MSACEAERYQERRWQAAFEEVALGLPLAARRFVEGYCLLSANYWLGSGGAIPDLPRWMRARVDEFLAAARSLGR